MSFPYKTPLIRKPTDASWDSELESLPGITRITDDNLTRLSKLLSACDDVDSYLTSPTYYQFTGRRGLWLYEKDDAFLLLSRHPNIVDQILIFPQLGNSKTDLTADLLSIIPNTEDKIRLARVKPGQGVEEKELHTDDRSVILHKREEDVLDWKYPLHILSTDGAAALDGSQYRRLRYAVKQANDSSPQLAPFDAVSHSRALENLLHRWASLNAKTREEYELLYAPYDNLFSQSMERSSGLAGLMAYTDGTLQAVSLWDVSNAKQKTANLYVDFCNVQVPGLSEYMIVKSCEALSQQGIKYLNMGGSEGEGLDSFKRKFRPVKSIDLFSVDAEVLENFHPAPSRTVDPSQIHQISFRRVPSV